MKNSLKFWISIVSISVLVACASKPINPDDRYLTLKIYHTNDVHAHLLPNGEGRGGLAYLASILKVIKGEDSGSLILDAGDYYKKGSLPTRKTKDELTAQILEKLPYDVRTVGNNEVKIGISKILQFASKYESNHRLISANFVDRNGQLVFPSHVEMTVGGLRVALIGLTHIWEIEKDYQPDPAEDSKSPYRVVDWKPTVSSLYPDLRKKNDVVIFLSHLGYTEDRKLAQAFPDVDAIVGGHSHTLTEELENSTKLPLITQAGAYGEQLGVLQLTFDKQAKKVVRGQSTFWSVGEEYQLPDAELAEVIQNAYKTYAPDALEVIGQVDDELDLIEEESPYEGGYHDFVADVLRKSASADVALVNRQALREPLRPGKLTKDALWMASPYEDPVVKVQIPREKLLRLIKSAVKRDWAKERMFSFGLSGLKAQLELVGENLKNLEIRLPSQKKSVTVAMPEYAYQHCEEIFASQDCSEPLTKIGATLQEVQLKEFKKMGKKHLLSPTDERVSVIQN